MSKDDGASILDELDSRLDDFFSEDDLMGEEDFSDNDHLDEGTSSDASDSGLSHENKAVEEPKPEPASEQIPSVNMDDPLNSLKAVVLEMDWEISDENLNKYLAEIDKLKKIYSNDRPLFLFLKLHTSIGQYMIRKKAGANPEALKFLYTVFNNLEKAMTKKLSVAEKNVMILNEVDNFMNLKAKIFPNLYKPVEKTPVVVEPVPQLDFSNLPENVQVDINSYIKDAIASKIEAMKDELK